MQKDKSRENQSIFDFCVWKYGSLEFISNLVFENDLKFDDVLQTSTELKTNELIGIENVKKSFKESLKVPISVPEIQTMPDNARIYENDSPRIYADNSYRIYK